MRVKIAQEIEDLGFSHILHDGAIKWDEGAKIPLVNQAGDLLGHAEDIQREEGGVITAEIGDFLDDLSEEMRKAVGCTIYCNELELRHEGDKDIVASAKLREVFVSPGVPWSAEPR